MAFEQWLWLFCASTLCCRAQYNIVLSLVMSAHIIIVHDESGDDEVFMPGTLPPYNPVEFCCFSKCLESRRCIIGLGVRDVCPRGRLVAGRPIWGQSRLETSRRPNTFAPTDQDNKTQLSLAKAKADSKTEWRIDDFNSSSLSSSFERNPHFLELSQNSLNLWSPPSGRDCSR